MRLLRMYSSRKNSVACMPRSLAPPEDFDACHAFPKSYMARMSPPAQKALPPAPFMITTTSWCGCACHALYFGVSALTMLRFSAFNAFGRLSVITTADPLCSSSTSASGVVDELAPTAC